MKPVAREKVRLGWVTTWNTKCGIASYSSYLLHYLPSTYTTRILASHKDYLLGEDGPGVIRCWEHNNLRDLDDLEKAIFEGSLDVVGLQFQFAFCHLYSFAML